jgi:hypothetical protein
MSRSLGLREDQRWVNELTKYINSLFEYSHLSAIDEKVSGKGVSG